MHALQQGDCEDAVTGPSLYPLPYPLRTGLFSEVVCIARMVYTAKLCRPLPATSAGGAASGSCAEAGRRVLVKFSAQPNAASCGRLAHEAAAAVGLAPKLWQCERLAGGLVQVG